MPKKTNPKVEIKKQLEKIVDTVDVDMVNLALKGEDITKFDISKKTLMNIAKWFLDGKSVTEVRSNLELTLREWDFLIKTCPAVVQIMQHSTAYAEMVVGASLMQTAIGGTRIKKKIPLKVHEYEVFNGKSVVVGEHYEMVEIEEVLPPNPMLLKYLAENKLSEKFGNKKVDNSKEYADVLENMSEEEINLLKAQSNGDKAN